MSFLHDIVSDLESRAHRLKKSIENKMEHTIDWSYFVESEDQLLELMNNQPPPPNAPGSINLSWALYALNNALPSSLSWLKELLRDTGMPTSKITDEDWSKWDVLLNGKGVLSGNGCWVAMKKFAEVDPGWLLSALDYFLLKIDEIEYAPFGATPTTLSLVQQEKVTVAIFGDWGTGEYPDGNLPSSPSQMIMHEIRKAQPDICIHLGDVYYAGTATEEQENLLKNWYVAPLGNFTMNSNHEMYDGANGYFKTALKSDIFTGQQETSYFTIELDEWLIIGLDSAYYDTSSLFLEGAITDPAQLEYLQKAGATDKKIMLLTHHTGLNAVGSKTMKLWDQVVKALGRQPDYWYWGHEHNGIVYDNLLEDVHTLCRCVGNASIPIGNASWFESAENILFYTKEPVPDPSPDLVLRVMNGFALLTFTAQEVQEKWLYQNGQTAWTFP